MTREEAQRHAMEIAGAFSAVYDREIPGRVRKNTVDALADALLAASPAPPLNANAIASLIGPTIERLAADLVGSGTVPTAVSLPAEYKDALSGITVWNSNFGPLRVEFRDENGVQVGGEPTRYRWAHKGDGYRCCANGCEADSAVEIIGGHFCPRHAREIAEDLAGVLGGVGK